MFPRLTQYEKTNSYKNCADNLHKLRRILCHLKKDPNKGSNVSRIAKVIS